MKIIFAGTPHFAAAALEGLLAQRFNVVAVLTQPDRPAGRGMQLAASAVKQLALQHGIPVLQPTTLRDADVQRDLASYDADVMVVAAYGLILPQAVLQLPRHGCLNIHASLLPRWRGAAPIQRAILAGDRETGITIMQMDVGLDTGDMLLKKTCPIEPNDTTQTLHDRLAALGAKAIVEALGLLGEGRLVGEPQDDAQATYAAKLTKGEAQIDWRDDAVRIARAIRAYNPHPGAFSSLGATPIKIWRATVPGREASVAGANDIPASESDRGASFPGTVLSVGKDGIMVACGQGLLNLEILQRPNARALPAEQFVQGFSVQPGARFSEPA